MTSIYVAIPSVQDTEYNKTLEDIFSNADNPQNVFVGSAHSIPFKNSKIINEIKSDTKKYGDHVRLKFLNKYRSEGVGFGRRESMSMYDGEDYVMQIDSHTMLEPSWDTKILKHYSNAQSFSKSSKTILSCYLPGYQYIDKNSRQFIENRKPMYSCYITEQDKADGLDSDKVEIWESIYSQIPRWTTPSNEDFYEFIGSDYAFARKLNANFIFSEKIFAEDYNYIVPWDFLFYEEEFIMSVEAFDLGYSFVHPNLDFPLGHIYANQFNDFYSRASAVDPNYARIDEAKRLIFEYFSTKNNKTKLEKYCKYTGLSYPELQSLSLTYLPKG
jgi:hypothetical protein